MAVQKLVETGVTVLNVTCDGPRVQLSAMRLLGAVISSGKPVHTRILSDLDCPPIYFILDAVHCIKLIRNSWAKLKIIKNSKGENIEWKFIEQLLALQQSEGLHCANKLSNLGMFDSKIKR